MRSCVLAAAAFALAVTNAAGAQQSASASSTPFRAGQWAMWGDIGAQVGVGLLRFSSPTGALALSVSGSLARRTTEFSNGTGGTIEQTSWGGSLATSAGVRRYRPVTSAVALFHTFGLAGHYQRFLGVRDVGGGPFADLGGLYLFGERFSLGVTSALTLNYNVTSYSGPDDREDRSLSLQGGATRVSATVYF